MSVFLSLQNSLSLQNWVWYTKYPGETLFLKAHIFKSMTLNGRRCTDCDEDHRTISFIAVFLSAARVPAGRDERKSKDPEDVSLPYSFREFS
jgi:hypothetical protein